MAPKGMCIGLNIALNMPVGCEFWINDEKVPFTPGSAFFINTSYLHWVKNNSDERRIHLLVHAKGRFASSFDEEPDLSSYLI